MNHRPACTVTILLCSLALSASVAAEVTNAAPDEMTFVTRVLAYETWLDTPLEIDAAVCIDQTAQVHQQLYANGRPSRIAMEAVRRAAEVCSIGPEDDSRRGIVSVVASILEKEARVAEKLKQGRYCLGVAADEPELRQCVTRMAGYPPDVEEWKRWTALLTQRGGRR
ncbi:hypothetical protein SAMN04488595_11856 [Ralstonia sp. 25mfcol4.1]|uniref:hypothetical protein n=1 Tax=Ralstonia sp. 25mfcol4.1 TaxID=1761899 RepID=UPI00048C7066|nr:hypothetical protein [Ralstonia sp. 25mfcol4.1]SDP72473.1 hypothetical protein SAMN04488595_11856 [Ralstonia sp. 25mfcol4.1]